MTSPTCHPDRRHRARGLCSPCYMRERDRARPPRPYDPDYSREYRKAHRLEILERQRASHAANPELRPAQQRAYRETHREAISTRNREWRASNTTMLKGYMRGWWAANPDAKATHSARRRALKRDALGTHTAQEWREKVALFAGCCAYCGEARPLVREHKVPLVRGGSNDITNIVPSCAPCNLRKSTKTAAEFLAIIASAQPLLA